MGMAFMREKKGLREQKDRQPGSEKKRPIRLFLQGLWPFSFS
jgi:hypothetical protein